MQNKSLLRGWLGGKYRLAKHIITSLPEHNCYVEPFCGAAWVLFTKEESKVEVLNDLNLDVINLYRVVQHHLEEFIRQFKWILVHRDEFSRLMRVPPDTLTDIHRAVRFFYLQRNGFGGKVPEAGSSFGYATTRAPKLNLLRLEEELSAAHLRLSGVYLEHLPYSDVIRRYDKPWTVFYIDPPYWNCEDYYGKGLFGKDDFLALASQLSVIKGKFIMSINDVPEIRETFKEFAFEEVTLSYSVDKKNSCKANELLISNV
ncbi:DNA adenine methylase [Dethiosulfatarculus sandiegensis]|uniref:site-specific DNA-methyltransferase (adenine-specific) n=1 Tax=Dethiosulfatarculus sandiegensis TaxID=1429043 RepID=A0A0D2JZQ1_9BACT|nr:DNA adenine methylase [Dethiosulfatarculus sandiegensis]KIX14990.1 restriction endonuclease subunit M [Dethiosulfatarculus sandiegensis]